MNTLTAQLTACGFTPLADDRTATHACGQTVHFGGEDGLTLRLRGAAAEDAGPVTLDFPDELEWFCRRYGLLTPFAQLHAGLAPWPGEAAVPGVCYRDGAVIRARTALGDVTVRQGETSVTHWLDGQPWPDPEAHPSGDPRHGMVHAATPGGVLGVYDVQGGQSGEMTGTLTLTRGAAHVQVIFDDDDVAGEVWLHAPNLTNWVPASNAAQVAALLAPAP